ncbi:MAG: RnfABCDGE type electron transport complex subunit C [Firmicutes bacterium]|nr:RnfABCDGE type electron transport complex subunit C [Bacillota bacterium]
MPYVFHGGIYPDLHGDTKNTGILEMTPPGTLMVPMLSCGVNAGNHYRRDYEPAKPIVRVGERVLRGQRIADGEKGKSCPVFSPVSGHVSDIGTMSLPDGRVTPFVQIYNDSEMTLFHGTENMRMNKRLSECTFEEIALLIRRAGIVDTGRGNVPLADKLELASGRVECCILNCIEDEPYISSDEKLLMETPETVLNGMKIVLKALGLREGIVALGENRPNLIKHLRRAIGHDKLFSIRVLKSKYPAGDERLLIYALARHELPLGKTPYDSGFMTVGPSALADVYRTFVTGVPPLSRVLTVAGDCVDGSYTVKAPIGTSFSDIIEFVGGVKEEKEPSSIIEGGPLRGHGIFPDKVNEFVVTNLTSGVLVMSEGSISRKKEYACINCGRCADVCPMMLSPHHIYRLSFDCRYDEAVSEGAALCIGCGSCTYVCPGGIDVSAYILHAADAVREHNDINRFIDPSFDGSTEIIDEAEPEAGNEQN